MKRTLLCTLSALLFSLQAAAALAKPSDASQQWDYLHPIVIRSLPV